MTIERITRTAMLAVAFMLCATGQAWADLTMANPVTGESESYSYQYKGSATNSTWKLYTNWVNSDGSAYSNSEHDNLAPNIPGSGVWNALLFDGNSLVDGASKTVSAETIEGYTLNVGLFGGVQLTIDTLYKWQGGCSVKVDSTSKLTISKLGSGTYDGANNFYVASAEGITYDCDYGKSGTFYYHFAGSGSVVYKNLTGGKHTIKAADVTLEKPATKERKSKKLVTFTNSPTFSIDAAIKVNNSSGTLLKVIYLNSIVDTTPTITTDDAAGTCQLVNVANDGIYLYWIDGEFSATPCEESISINFAHGGNKIEDSYSTAYGAGSYAVRAAYWNTMTSVGGNTGTFSTPLSTVYKMASTGLKERVADMSVDVSETRGSWASSGGNILHGYIDDNQNNSQSPTVTVTGIPEGFAHYRVIMYFSNNSNGTKFGYVTINEKNYWGTDSWGSANYAAFAEDGNYKVSPVIARGSGTLTVVTHCPSGARSGLAAIQIFKVDAGYIASDDGTGALAWNTTLPASGSADGIIDLAGDATLTVDSAASFGKLSVTGFGTLTLAGSAKISATTIDVGKNVVVNMNAARLDATTYTGSGTVVYTGAKPASGKGWTDSANWTGTVWVKDITTSSNDRKDWNPAPYGNVNSTLRFTNVNLYFPNNTTTTFPGTVDLDGTGLNICDGYGGSIATFARLTGSGTLATGGGSANGNGLTINDVSGFTGAVTLTKYKVIIGTSTSTSASGVLQIESGKVATVASGKTWAINANVIVNGELDVNGFIWANNGIAVNGKLVTPRYATEGDDKTFGAGTAITVTSLGTFQLTSTGNGNESETERNYAKITGSGAFEYNGSGWRALSTNNFPTAMKLVNEQSGDILLSRAATYYIGSLSGTKNIQGNYDSGNRYLNILQNVNTEWSGKVSNDAYSRLAGVTINSSSTGTLTLSGTATQSVPLTIAGGSVKITGTWKGATSVTGSLAFGGANGTKVDGDVTTASGSTLDFMDFTQGTVAPISGALTLDTNTTIRLPAGAAYPYKLAGSIAGVSELAANKYTVGGIAGVVPLKLNSDGSANLDSVAAFTGDNSWDSLGWNVTPSMGVECTVNVTGSGTLTLNQLIQLAKVTFNVPSDKTLTLTGGSIIASEKICFTGGGTVVCGARNTLAGTITGSATINYPDHVLPLGGQLGAVWTDPEWCGTLVLTNCGREQNTSYPSGETHDVVRFDQYGSEYSTIRAPGYKGISAVTAQNTTCEATLFIDSGEVVEFNHGDGASALNTNGAGFRFAKLAGTGTLRLDGTSDTAQYIFDDVSAFTGNVEITFPETGGRKSFLFGATTGFDVMNSAYAANLVILGDMTVGTGNYEGWTWDVPAGIIIAEGKTLTLSSGATVRALGKDSEGTIKVAAGTELDPVTATLEGITNSVFNGRLEIGEYAKLQINDPSLTTLTIPADSTTAGDPAVARTYSNEGTLDLSGCTALTKLHLALGEANTFDFSKVTLPATCKDIYYDIGGKRNLTGYSLETIGSGTLENVTNICYYATETPSEYANGGFVVSNVTAGTVWLIRQNGALIKTTASGTDRTYAGGGSFAGGACWHEWDFEKTDLADRLKDWGRFSLEGADANSRVTLATEGSVTESDYSTCHIDVQGEDKNILSSAVHPYAALSLSAPWSAAIRCSMPTVTGSDKAVAIAFGDTTNGMVGLAATANDMVELFNWTPTDGGTYTALAQLKVESPANKNNMHIYVLTVTNEGGNNYVSLYRDAEFVHTAQFTLASAITRFRVGDVCGDREGLAGIPLAVANANTGYVDYVRLYDKVLPDEDIAGLSLRRPFVSAIDLYERTASLFENWSESGAWTLKPGNNGTPTTAEAPVAAANVTFTADGTTDMSLNLAADVRYGTLIIQGSGAMGLHQTSTGRIGAEMFVVRSGVNLTVDYNAVNLATYDGENLATATTVGVDSGASLKFDFSEYPFGGVTATTTITLIDNAPDPAYNVASRSRYSVVLPDTLPINISTVADSWDGASYKLTITVDHEAGGTVYYKEGTLTSGMTVYTDSEFTAPTKLFPNDTLVVSSNSSTGDLTIDDSFNGNLSVTRTTVNLASTGNAALASKTVTVATGCTLNFAGGEFGAMTLVGPGSFAFTQNTTVASLTDTFGKTNAGEKISIAVNDGVTLTLRNETPFVSGGVSGAGTIKLPVHTSGGLDFSPYFHNDGTIAVTRFDKGFIKVVSINLTTALRLDGDMNITDMSPQTYTFAKISGTGNLSFSDKSAVIPTFTITNLADYDGTIINNHASANVTITKLTKTGVYVAGDVLLTKGSGTRTGSVVVSKVEIGGSTKHGFWAGDNYLMAAAEYDGQGYTSVNAAITAAGAENLGDIIVYDTTVTPGAQYKFVTDDEGVTRVAQMSIAVKKNGEYLPTGYTDNIWDAIVAIYSSLPSPGEYDYIEILSGSTFVIPYDRLGEGTLKIRNNGATPIPQGLADDCEVTDNDIFVDAAYQYTEYSKGNKPEIYTWTGEALESSSWETSGNWSYVNSSIQTVQASRQPQAGDSVVFNTAAVVAIGFDAAVAAITVDSGATCELGGSFKALSLGTVTVNAGTLVVTAPSGVTPTYTLGAFTKVNVADGAEGAKVYTFSLRPGTIFSVY